MHNHTKGSSVPDLIVNVASITRCMHCIRNHDLALEAIFRRIACLVPSQPKRTHVQYLFVLRTSESVAPYWYPSPCICAAGTSQKWFESGLRWNGSSISYMSTSLVSTSEPLFWPRAHFTDLFERSETKFSFVTFF